MGLYYITCIIKFDLQANC